MNTPIYDFVTGYAASGTARFHVPGHKGVPLLGPEPLDLTELKGADSLYEADGIIAESERNASSLFGSGATFYSAEGSSLCIRAMLQLLLAHRPEGTARTIFAARNVHKSFVYAAALLDADVVWLYPETTASVISCLISPAILERTLRSAPQPPAAVYITSPDYLGAMQDIAALAKICHRYGTRLAVDNAHGAYLHFIPNPIHPLDLGADICCDSAHKTLPVLTGGAYLHLAESCSEEMIPDARSAMSLFGSTSPSYLILASLDLCNRYLASPDFQKDIIDCLNRTGQAKQALRKAGWMVIPSDPMRIALRTDGVKTAERLRAGGVEPEFSDNEFVVLMPSTGTSAENYDALVRALGKNDLPVPNTFSVPVEGRAVMSLREPLMYKRERIPVEQAVGRVCADPSVGCPPAVPVVMPGELITPDHIALLKASGIRNILVVR